MDEEEQFGEVRKRFVEKIEHQLDLCPKASSPTAIQERSFQEVLHHIVRLVSSNEPFEINGGFFCCNLRDDDIAKRNRKQSLKRILNQLKWMEHKRLYDPPADDEIGYYLLMKKYMRSILAFFLATASTRATYIERRFGCCSTFRVLQNDEELAGLNQHLSDLSEFLSNMDIEKGSPFNPLMGIKDNYDVAEAVCGSKARGYMFYRHKFKLAQIDLRNTEFAFCPPSEEERRSYIQALDNIAPSLIGKKDDTNAFFSELVALHAQRTKQEVRDIERHCEKIKQWILKNLSLTEFWEYAVEQYFSCTFLDEEYGEGEEEEEGINHEGLANFRKAMAEKCEVPIQDLPLYISHVDRCITLSRSMLLLVMDRYGDCLHLTDCSSSTLMRDAVNAMTLLKPGSTAGSVLRDQPMLQNTKPNAAEVRCEPMRKCKNVFHGQCQEENLGILKGILEDLRHIGGSNVELDEEEMVLVHKIWASIASSVHFFISAMAYELEQDLMQDNKLCDVSELQARQPERRHGFTSNWVDFMLFTLVHQMYAFMRILYHYKTGLVEKM